VGKLLDVRISTIAKTPAQPPIQDAAIIHHAEIILLPRFFGVAVAGNEPGCGAGFSLCRGRLIVCLVSDIVMRATSANFPFALFDSNRCPAWQSRCYSRSA
jgi:hypothetical protein